MGAPKKPAATTRKQVDWSVIEREYRAGVKSLEQIGKENGVTKGRISQVAKREAWPRDLLTKIKAKADAKVNAAAVNKELNAKSGRLADSLVVDANAELQYRIRLAQRNDIQRARKLTMNLLGELEVTSDNHELMSQLGTLMDSPDDRGVDKLNELYRKVTSLTGRVSNMKQLAESLKTLIGLEREAFGIDEKAKTIEGEVASLLSSIGKRSAFPVAD